MKVHCRGIEPRGMLKAGLIYSQVALHCAMQCVKQNAVGENRTPCAQARLVYSELSGHRSIYGVRSGTGGN